ncbi:M3 family metallopeptidase [Plebeiibacterium sediminum]|uniref:M3 family metallopeptidase n=1 Tax=Plebeiibacterium sediminum TaxID=2992112 RepID=A0AAE3M8W3_9BACT|nr:M3 family metallopeptidase [Plebeiobacterium sediminum]MCW3789127.1 M3 family metallopeptidase [Plebeiobacterium sediminum]
MKRKTLFFTLASLLFIVGCTTKNKMETNPFLVEYNTPFKIAPFEEIKNHHYMPAFIKGMEEQNKNIAAIVENKEAPTFENTIEALEYSDDILAKVSNVFYNLTSSNTNDSIKAIAQEVAPLLSKHSDAIFLNKDLFERIKTVYNQKDQLNLPKEAAKLLTETYESFARGGANLPEEAKEEFSKINGRLAVLTLQFGDNVLNETNNYIMVVDNEADLKGLPKNSIDAASQLASKKGYDGKWVFTTHKPSMIPFLQYAENRDLREKLFNAYINRGDNDNEYDNKKIISEIVSLRIRRAELLGYKNHASFILERNMAKTPEAVYKKLAYLMDKAQVVAKKEAKDMQQIINSEGGNFKLQPWDWWYYAEKVKMKKYNLDENEIRPYFELKNVIDGALYTANQLYGLQFEKKEGLPLPHPDAIAFEVKESTGYHVGILYMDFHPRESKRGGAWMNSFRKQHRRDGLDVTPIITMVCNFTSPTDDTPSLLSIDEVETLFHEFGHCLHGLLSDCTYRSLSGTAVPRDFVELPSQVMEHWSTHPTLLKYYAKNYKTGEIIPDELIAKIENSGKFNQGFATTEYLAAAILDMDYHTLTEPIKGDINEFEKASIKKMNLIPEIVSRYRSTYFQHVFSGGYSAGYYAYIWAAILDSDAFDSFEEKGIFDQETATKFRTNILEKGGTEDAMEMYINFKGNEPDENALLRDRGLI